MPAFLTTIGAALSANALKWGLALALLLAAAGGGFVLGDSHATSVALKASAADADARVAAARKQDQATTSLYLGQLNTQKTRGDALAASLAQSQSQLAAATQAAKETILHAIPENSACDLPVSVVASLRAQPARQ
jgi:hypothetical protein